jgi:transposase
MENIKKLVEKIQDYDFKSEYKRERDPIIKIKFQALHHLQSGKLLKDVADIILYDEKAIRRWVRAFVKHDYEGLIEKEGRGQKPRLPKDKEEDFIIAIDKIQEERNGGRITVEDIQKLLIEKFDCNYSRQGVYTLLDRLNIVWISGRSKHPKHSSEVIENFKETFPEEVEKIKDKIDNKKIEIWWQDESRIGQQGSLSRVWATKGTRPRVVRQRQFLSTYIFGACCPDKDKGCALILPECTASMMQIHLEEISKQVEIDFHAIVLMDRASWHTTEALNIPQNISLLPLPPYSPELNPMEQVWQKIKHSQLSNRVFKNYNEIVKACVQAWNSFCDEDGNIRSLCSRAWAKL